MHWLSQPRGEGSGLISRIVNGLRKVDRDTGWTTFYMVCLAMLPISGLLLTSGSMLWPNLHPGKPGADEVCSYMGILSILIVHYVHDALLFTDSRAIVE